MSENTCPKDTCSFIVSLAKGPIGELDDNSRRRHPKISGTCVFRDSCPMKHGYRECDDNLDLLMSIGLVPIDDITLESIHNGNVYQMEDGIIFRRTEFTEIGEFIIDVIQSERKKECTGPWRPSPLSP